MMPNLAQNMFFPRILVFLLKLYGHYQYLSDILGIAKTKLISIYFQDRTTTINGKEHFPQTLNNSVFVDLNDEVWEKGNACRAYRRSALEEEIE